MREYEYKEKEVKIGSQTYKAIIPKRHSRIKGLIFNWRDQNSDDDWANIQRWMRTMYVLYKGDTEWTHCPMNDEMTKWAKKGLGFLAVLHNLESERVKKRIWKSERVQFLESDIAAKQGELRKLVGEKRRLEA